MFRQVFHKGGCVLGFGLLLTNAKLAKVVSSHGIKMATVRYECGVVQTARDSLDHDVE